VALAHGNTILASRWGIGDRLPSRLGSRIGSAGLCPSVALCAQRLRMMD
jgi:hypothetical protein